MNKVYFSLATLVVSIGTIGLAISSCTSLPKEVVKVPEVPVEVIQLPDCHELLKSFVNTKTKNEQVVPQPTPDGGILLGLVDQLTGIIRIRAVANDKIGAEIVESLKLVKVGVCEVPQSGWKYNIYKGEVKQPGLEANAQ